MGHTISAPAGRAALRAPKRLLALRGDEFLLTQLRSGSEAAFEVLYERHVAGILSFCRHMLGSLQEAEDAVQDVFAAAHRDLLRDEREMRLKPWLYAIARNRCLSMLRSRREHADETLAIQTEGLDNEVERRADLRELVRDLQDLPEDQRAALVLSELRDLSHADVAGALGLEVANVKGLVFRARSGLIERRDARSTSCEEIQEELASARGSTLRRGRLRHHLRSCSDCSDYLEQVRAQRKALALILPVVPTLGLKKGVLAAVGIGGGAGGGGGAAAGGGGLLAAALPAGGATVAKVAVVGALLGGAGVAVESAVDNERPPASSGPAITPADAGNGARLRARETRSARADERSGSAARWREGALSETPGKPPEGGANDRPKPAAAGDPTRSGPAEANPKLSPQLPSSSLPTPRLPSGKLPSAELPSVKLPSARVPSPQLPPAELPAPQLPSPALPGSQAPSAELPASGFAPPQLPAPRRLSP